MAKQQAAVMAPQIPAEPVGGKEPLKIKLTVVLEVGTEYFEHIEDSTALLRECVRDLAHNLAADVLSVDIA
jgi:hypothetical protein